MLKPDAVAYFWRNVRKTPGCWIWARSKGNSYGSTPDGAAHRVSWAIHNGPIPEGMIVCHRCDHKPCVNPEHLFLGTHGDNLRDYGAKARSGWWFPKKPGTAKIPMADREVLRVKEAAIILGVAPALVYRMARKGTIPHKKIGTVILIHRDTVAGLREATQ